MIISVLQHNSARQSLRLLNGFSQPAHRYRALLHTSATTRPGSYKIDKSNISLESRRQLPTAPAARLSSTATTAAAQNARPADFSSLPPYQRPRTGLIGALPDRLVPYAELVRLDKPAGTYYLFLPCLFSTLLAAPAVGAPPAQVAAVSALFLAGAFIMRSAGCTINDFWDRRVDPLVSRTRHRPLARGAIAPAPAAAFFAGQCLAGLAVLVNFPAACIWAAVPSVGLVVAYPLAKRVTDYPQLVFGLTFSWGTLLGFPALGAAGALFAAAGPAAATAALYASSLAWCVLYDTVYAHMDVKDDRRAGVRSIVVAHGGTSAKPTLAALAAAQVGTLALAGAALGASPVFYALSVGGAAATLARQIYSVDLAEPADCLWWFTNGCWITGGAITTGLLAEYLYQYYKPGEGEGDEAEKGEGKEEEVSSS